MNKHKITIDRVVCHYDASRKICPESTSKNNWKKWNEFKDKLQKKEIYYRVMAGSYRNRENAENQVAKLESAGFDATIMLFNKS